MPSGLGDGHRPAILMEVKGADQLETRRIPEGRAGYRHPLRFEGFLFVCPKTKESIRGEIEVEYTPFEMSIDPKSFERYSTSFRNSEIRREGAK
jgi:NADPH-dependent 7-cyano-7-deazaguanine reductase QueF